MSDADARWEHGWGFRDTKFEIGPDGHVVLQGSRYDISGFPMPGFLPFCNDVLGVEMDTSEPLQRSSLVVPPPNKNEAFCQALESEFKADQYSFEDSARATHSHGQATADEVHQALYGSLSKFVDMVFYVRSEDAAVRLTQLAAEHNVCLVPFGGGTNVTGALFLPQSETRMIVSVDTSGLNKIEWINKDNRQACVQAGITGRELERLLEAQGFMSGHEPDSMEFSTLGGWISTNASGMKRHRYGGIEDIVEQITLVTPTGVLETYEMFARQSAGMQVRPALFGSEGNLGLITKAVIRIHELPEKRTYQSLIFPSFERGVDFLKELSSTTFLPASIRLVDNLQFRFGHALKPAEDGALAAIKSKAQRLFLEKVKHIDLKQMAAATLVMEGTKSEVSAQEKLIGELAAKYDGFFGGGSNGQRGYNLTFAIAYIRDFLAQFHVMGETLETTAPWHKLHDICAALKAEALRIHADFELEGVPFVSFRITQLYPTGVCLYTTYAAYTKGKDSATIAREADKRLRRAIIGAGGAISNHHGIGKFRSDVFARELPASNARVLQSIKQSIDPSNVYGIANGVFAAEFSTETQVSETPVEPATQGKIPRSV